MALFLSYTWDSSANAMRRRLAKEGNGSALFWLPPWGITLFLLSSLRPNVWTYCYRRCYIRILQAISILIFHLEIYLQKNNQSPKNNARVSCKQFNQSYAQPALLLSLCLWHCKKANNACVAASPLSFSSCGLSINTLCRVTSNLCPNPEVSGKSLPLPHVSQQFFSCHTPKCQATLDL